MEQIREKLREFYQKQHLESLSVRKTASNVLLVEKRDGKKTILARYSLVMGDPCAKLLAEDARCRLAYARSCEDMVKVEQPPAPVPQAINTGILRSESEARSLAGETLPTDAEGMEMPLKDWKPAPAKLKSGSLDMFVPPDMFDRTASDAKPLE